MSFTKNIPQGDNLAETESHREIFNGTEMKELSYSQS